MFKDSSDDYIRGLKLFGKSSQVTTTGAQLFDASKLPSKELYGCSITNNGDGSFTISGSDMLSGDFIWHKDYTHEETISILKAGDLFFNIEKTTYPYLYISIRSESGALGEITNISETNIKKTVTQEMLDDETVYIRIGFWGTSNKLLVPGTIRPMLYQKGDGIWEPYSGGKPSPNPDYPQEIVSLENPTVNILTGNILDVKQLERKACATLDISDDGYTIKATGGTTGPYVAARLSVDDSIVKALRGQTVIFSMDSISSEQDVHVGPQLTIHKGKDVIYYAALSDSNRKTEVTFPNSLTGLQLGVYVNNVPDKLETDNSVIVTGIMMSLKESAWEPHKNKELAITHTLPGIPVTSGGNYTDSDGQQWICDEIDLERGVYMQRVYNETVTFHAEADTNGTRYVAHLTHKTDPLYNGFVWCNKLLFNEHTNPGTNGIRISTYSTDLAIAYYNDMVIDSATVLYPLATPIETPLTAEEIATFKALRTNKPNTTILNDAGAWMSVKYNADTKTYVDAPKVVKLVDSSTGVVYELTVVDGNLTVTPI